MCEQADPFRGLGAIRVDAAAEFRAPIWPLVEPRRAEVRYQGEITGFIQAIDECLHSAGISAPGVGQRRGNQWEAPGSQLKRNSKPEAPNSDSEFCSGVWRLEIGIDFEL